VVDSRLVSDTPWGALDTRSGAVHEFYPLLGARASGEDHARVLLKCPERDGRLARDGWKGWFGGKGTLM